MMLRCHEQNIHYTLRNPFKLLVSDGRAFEARFQIDIALQSPTSQAPSATEPGILNVH